MILAFFKFDQTWNIIAVWPIILFSLCSVAKGKYFGRKPPPPWGGINKPFKILGRNKLQKARECEKSAHVKSHWNRNFREKISSWTKTWLYLTILDHIYSIKCIVDCINSILWILCIRNVAKCRENIAKLTQETGKK